MKCSVHPDVDATGFCRNCGKALCPQCTRDVSGAFYCEECLSRVVFGPQTAAAAPKSSRPAVALALGLIPGLGAVYNGEYFKALINICIFGALITAQHSVWGGFRGFIQLAIFCFYFYMPIDAYNVAKARETGQPEPNPLHLPAIESRIPVAAFLLIGLGLILLVSNLGFINWDWLSKFWPVGLIALGGWILARRAKETSGSDSGD